MITPIMGLAPRQMVAGLFDAEQAQVSTGRAGAAEDHDDEVAGPRTAL